MTGRHEEQARALVMAHGWNATAYQILNPGIVHWLWPAGEAVVGCFRGRKRWVAAGAPVCAPEHLDAAATAFEREAGRHSARVSWFGADARFRATRSGRPGFSEVPVGAQPVWNPARWPAILAGKASLRAQVNRARNKGVEAVAWPSERAERNEALHRCLGEWLDTRGLPAMHFLVETEILGRLRDRRVFVAERGGEAVAFLVASPVPARRGWLVEQIVRGHGAPNGTGSLLIDAAMRGLAADGAAYLTLGLAPLSRRAADAPLWLRGLLGWVRAHGRRFYNFEGLEAFKAKYVPDRWDSLTMITNEPVPRPATLYATADAFSGASVSPIAFLGRALSKALAQEVRTLGSTLSSAGRRT